MTKALFSQFTAVFFPLLTLTGPTPAAADSHETCIGVLGAPPFVDILTRNDGRDFAQISAGKIGQELVGLECSVEELTEFFENGRWKFLRFEEKNGRYGPVVGTGDRPPYYTDSSAFFCQKRRTFWTLYTARCQLVATVSFDKGRISNIGAHVSK